MLKHTNLFYELPEKYYDSAFLDRLHFYIPGWEIDIIRGEMFSSGYGFVVDYLAEILRNLRTHDFSQKYTEHFTLSKDISTRDRDGINKTFSGLMKILYPSGEASKDEIEELLHFSVEGRKRVKDQLLRIDTTYAGVQFSYWDNTQKAAAVKTLEEEQYPQYYWIKGKPGSPASPDETEQSPVAEPTQSAEKATEGPTEKHLTFQENQRGVSFNMLLGPYLKGATKIVVTDPYIRMFFQARNLMEFLETVAYNKQDEDEVSVHLITVEDEFKGPQQLEYFQKMQES